MQKILLLLPLLVAAIACTNNQTAAGTPTAAASTPASSDDASVPGPVTFSLTIDGQTVTGTSAGQFPAYNVGTTAIDPNDKPEFRFVLADIKTAEGKPTRTVSFQSPTKVGSHHVDCSGDDHFYGLEITYQDDHSDQYCGDDVTLNVTEVSDTRVKGNFSGKFTLIGRPQQKTVKVDCVFDIPRAKQ